MNPAPLLLHIFPTFAVGGSQTRFAAIANHFGPGYRHAVVALDGVFDCFDRLDPALEAKQWAVSAPKRNTIGNMRVFRSFLRIHRPDLLITYNWGAIEWALANRPKIVPHLHIEDGFGPEEAERQLRRRVLTRRFALSGSTVVLPSKTLCRIAIDQWRLRAERVRHIPNGVDLARFSAVIDPINVPPGPGPVIGTVAALRPEKNIARLLHAFARVRNAAPCRLLIAGDGPERSSLEQLASQIVPPNSIVFSGYIGQVERVYASIDIFALSSDTEQMPTSLMEAMARGLPVVSTKVGDVAEMVSSENRPFVVSRSEDAIAGALIQLTTDPAARAALGSANRTAAAVRFDIARMFDDYKDVFSRLMSFPSPDSAPSRRPADAGA